MTRYCVYSSKWDNAPTSVIGLWFIVNGEGMEPSIAENFANNISNAAKVRRAIYTSIS